VDLFAQGEAQLYLKPTRELQTLASFDVTVSRAAIALDMERFLAGSAIAEMTLRVGGGEANVLLYKAVSDVLGALTAADPGEVATHAIAGAWRIVASCGFTPSLDECASCHVSLQQSGVLAFSPAAGGGLCDRCARMATTSRRLPPEARTVLQRWLRGELSEPLSSTEVRAHQRLFREFLTEHFPDDRLLKAFAVWESTLR
jgi:DNA repair protein RecO (recombination protein O)